MEGAKVRIVDTTTKEQNADSVHEPRGENSDWTGRANYYLENERTGAPSPLTLVDCSVWTDGQASVVSLKRQSRDVARRLARVETRPGWP